MPRGIPKNPRQKIVLERVEGAAHDDAFRMDELKPQGPRKDEFQIVADEFERAVAMFQEAMPGEWEACRLWPAQSGIAHIIEKMRARK